MFTTLCTFYVYVLTSFMFKRQTLVNECYFYPIVVFSYHKLKHFPLKQSTGNRPVVYYYFNKLLKGSALDY